ncbi:MAG: hypothetical protein ACK5PQ_01045 [Alphaproteobacteria bacterium]
MVKILLGFAFFLCLGFWAFAGFNPYGFSQPYYNPGPGYLQPSYSYQQPFGYNSGPGYPYMLKKPRSNNGKPSAFACTRFSCGT